MEKKELIEALLRKGILLSPDIAGSPDSEIDFDMSKINSESDLLVLNQEVKEIISQKSENDINWLEFEKSKVLYEKSKNFLVYKKFLDFLKAREKKPPRMKGNVNIIFSYNEESRKRDFDDFVGYFNKRYSAIEDMLKQRVELKGISSISRLKYRKERDVGSIIGIVQDKQETKNNNIMLTLEDPTGSMRVLVTKTKSELYNLARDVVLDEIIGVTGMTAEKILFANKILLPDIPTNLPFKKSPEENYAVFLSDIHAGSTKFLPKEFGRFLKWVNGYSGTAGQQSIAGKIKYIFIAGDLVDGVGVYPEQDTELETKDIYEQYKECAEYLSQIPQDIQLIVCPGNHDAMRISEPQPALSDRFASPLLKLPNLIPVSNPAYVTIDAQEGFPGFLVLMYHGYSFDHYIANVDSIRSGGGYDRADLMMKFLLQRRHLAPTHSSTLYIPDPKRDSLVIDKIPDFFVTGHIHKTSVSSYRNVTLISGSCWQSKTSFQEKVGHNPQPARVPVVNLKTRAIKVLKFGM